MKDELHHLSLFGTNVPIEACRIVKVKGYGLVIQIQTSEKKMKELIKIAEKSEKDHKENFSQ